MADIFEEIVEEIAEEPFIEVLDDEIGLPYDPFNWYWIKADGMIYSSRLDQEITVDNNDYQVWLSLGGVPTIYPKDEYGNESWAALMAILRPYNIGEINRIYNQLDKLDATYLTPRILSDINSEYSQHQINEHERLAAPLRERIKAIVKQHGG